MKSAVDWRIEHVRTAIDKDFLHNKPSSEQAEENALTQLPSRKTV